MILHTIWSFDLRGSADLWKCCVKLCSDHSAHLQQTDGKVIGEMLSCLIRRVADLDVQTTTSTAEQDAGEADRNMKEAIFYAKVLMRLGQLFRNALTPDLFRDFAGLFVSLKKCVW